MNKESDRKWVKELMRETKNLSRQDQRLFDRFIEIYKNTPGTPPWLEDDPAKKWGRNKRAEEEIAISILQEEDNPKFYVSDALRAYMADTKILPSVERMQHLQTLKKHSKQKTREYLEHLYELMDEPGTDLREIRLAFHGSEFDEGSSEKILWGLFMHVLNRKNMVRVNQLLQLARDDSQKKAFIEKIKEIDTNTTENRPLSSLATSETNAEAARQDREQLIGEPTQQPGESEFHAPPDSDKAIDPEVVESEPEDHPESQEPVIDVDTEDGSEEIRRRSQAIGEKFQAHTNEIACGIIFDVELSSSEETEEEVVETFERVSDDALTALQTALRNAGLSKDTLPPNLIIVLHPNNTSADTEVIDATLWVDIGIQNPNWVKQLIDILIPLKIAAPVAETNTPPDDKEPADNNAPDALETTASINVIIDKYLVYADVLPKYVGSPEYIQNSLNNPTCRAYAAALKKLLDQDPANVHHRVTEIRRMYEEAIQTLELSTSKFGKSITWAYWDIAKQYHLSTHPTNVDRQRPYIIDNPLTNDELAASISDRHLGWELYHAFKGSGEDWNLIARLNSTDPTYQEIKALLRKEPDSTGSPERDLNSYDLSQIGKLVRKNLGLSTFGSTVNEKPDGPKTPIQAVGEATKLIDDEPDSPDLIERQNAVWNSFENPHVQKEIQRLTPAEKKEIDTLTKALVQDASVFHITESKPHAQDRKSTEAVHPYMSFLVKNDDSNLAALDTALFQSLDPELQTTLKDSLGEDNIITILQHPSDAKKIVIMCTCKNPKNTSNADNRGAVNFYALVLKKNNPIVSFLRSGDNTRIFPFILRNAAVGLHPEARVFMDCPLSGPALFGEKGNGLVILDYPQKQITYFDETDTANIHSKTHYASSSREFRLKTNTFGIGLRPPGGNIPYFSRFTVLGRGATTWDSWKRSHDPSSWAKKQK